jgi:hypothetical protein
LVGQEAPATGHALDELVVDVEAIVVAVMVINVVVVDVEAIVVAVMVVNIVACILAAVVVVLGLDGAGLKVVAIGIHS